jgi:hypothetical protein
MKVKKIAIDPDPYEPFRLAQGYRVGELLFISGQAAIDARAKTVPTEFLADRFNLPSRYSLDVHLRERRHQRLLAALIALENLGGHAGSWLHGGEVVILED